MWQSEHPLTDNSSAIKFKKSPLGKRGEWIYTDFNGRKNNRLLFKIIKCLVEKLLFTFCSNVSFFVHKITYLYSLEYSAQSRKNLFQGEKASKKLDFIMLSIEPWTHLNWWDILETLFFAKSYIKLHLPNINCFINMINYYKTRL